VHRQCRLSSSPHLKRQLPQLQQHNICIDNDDSALAMELAIQLRGIGADIISLNLQRTTPLQ